MRRALLDAQAVLVGHGFVDWVAGGAAPDRVLVVADDFSLKPGAWRWNGAAWVAQPRMDVPAFVADLKAIFATPSAWTP